MWATGTRFADLDAEIARITGSLLDYFKLLPADQVSWDWLSLKPVVQSSNFSLRREAAA